MLAGCGFLASLGLCFLRRFLAGRRGCLGLVCYGSSVATLVCEYDRFNIMLEIKQMAMCCEPEG